MLESETASQEQQENDQSRFGLVFIIGALSAFGPLCLDMYLPGLPSLTQDLGGDTWEVQLTLTACLLGLAGGQIVAGPLSDALGRRRPLLVGLLTFTVTSLLCALAPSVPVLILLRFLQGTAGAAGIVIARAMVRDLYTGVKAARFFALTMAVNGVAPILAPVIGGQLLNFTSWRGVFVVLSAIGAALFVSAALGLQETLPPARRRVGGISITLKTFQLLLRDRYFVGYALSSGLGYGAMFAYIAGSPFVLENIYSISPQLFSLIFAINGLGIIITSQISGRLVGRVQPRKLLAFGLSGSVTGGLLLFVMVFTNSGLSGVLAGFWLVVASIGFIAPNATALALADHARVAGSASALLGVLQYIIGAAVTPLVNIGGNGTAKPLAAIMAVLGIGAVMIFLFLTGRASSAVEI